MYKVSNRLSPSLIGDTFKHKNGHPCNMRHNSHFSRPHIKTVIQRTETISYLRLKLFDILLLLLKNYLA